MISCARLTSPPNFNECLPATYDRLSTNCNRRSSGNAGRSRKLARPNENCDDPEGPTNTCGGGWLANSNSQSRPHCVRASLTTRELIVEVSLALKLLIRTSSEPLRPTLPSTSGV